MSYRSYVTVLLLASASLAACSGGGGGSSPLQPPATQAPSPNTSQAQSEAVISDENALGSPIKNFADFDKAIGPSAAGAQSSARSRATTGDGTCKSGVEFFVPDRNADVNSTETIDFYDTACTSEARDVVRVFAPASSSSESVAITEQQFAAGNATPIATRTETHTIANATFTTNGFPIAADGFTLVATDSLGISGSKTINSSRELVMGAAASGPSGFCSDSAGYNATGIANLHETFGWQGGVFSGGTRTVNADGTVTWTATHAGTTFKGPIGGLSVATGTQNTACPIVTPDFTLAGGTSTGTYSIPISATFLRGMLQSISIANATLSNGDTLNVTTNSGIAPSSPGFITGTIASGATQIASFALDAFGDGTLTLTSTGAQYVITDWHVVR